MYVLRIELFAVVIAIGSSGWLGFLFPYCKTHGEYTAYQYTVEATKQFS